MTRYVFSDGQEQYWAVGFDSSFASYFAQIDLENDAFTVADDTFGEVRSVDELKKKIEQIVQLPASTEEQLRANDPAIVTDLDVARARTLMEQGQ